MLRMLTDQARSKSELVAANARYAKASPHPAPTGETACLYQNGSDAPGASVQARQAPGSKRTSLVQEDDVTTVASPGIQALLEVQVEDSST